jgi:hypothetical protein
LKNVITNDETWVYDDVEAKPVFTLVEFCFILPQESTKGALASESSAFFGHRGIVQYEFTPEHQTIKIFVWWL